MSGQIREVLGLVFFILFYFPSSPTEVTRGWNFMQNGSKHV